MDVDRAARVPPRIDRLELGDAVRVRQLDAAQECPGLGAGGGVLAGVATRLPRRSGVVPLGVAVPGQRRIVTGRYLLDAPLNSTVAKSVDKHIEDIVN